MRGTMAMLRTALTSPDTLTRTNNAVDDRAVRHRIAVVRVRRQTVIVPVLLAWVIARSCCQSSTHLRNVVPARRGVATVTLLLLILIIGLLLLLTNTVTYWIGRARVKSVLSFGKSCRPSTSRLELLQDLQKSLNAIGTSGGRDGHDDDQGRYQLGRHRRGDDLLRFDPAVSQALLFIGALMFYLVYQKRIRSLFVKLVKERDARLALLKRLSDIDSSMSVYFGTFTLVNICLGLVTMALTWAVGLPTRCFGAS